MRGPALLLAAALLAGAGTARAQEVFGNDSLVALARAGVGAEVMLAKIDSSPCAYDVATGAILSLKAAGVPDRVIAAMIARCNGSAAAQGGAGPDADPKIRRPPGLYIDLGGGAGHTLVKLRPTNSIGGRATGNGSLLFPYRLSLAIPQASAQTVAASPQPTFYFYFETDDLQVGDFGTAGTRSAQSPSEFSLIRFRQKDGQRETAIATRKPFDASAGVDRKEAVQFTVTEIGDGIFAATPLTRLLPGQYGFVLSAEKGIYRFYDFAIRE